MRGRCKPEPKPLASKSPWGFHVLYQYRRVKVLCVEVREDRYWKTQGFLHCSPDEALDRIEGRLG